MATLYSILSLVLLFFSLLLSPTQSKSNFIVHVLNSHNTANFSAHKWHSSILQTLSSLGYNNTLNIPKLIYSYTHSATGFAASLSAAQAAELRSHPAVLSIIPDQVHQVQTTRTTQFLDLSEGSGLWPQSDQGSEIIIGVIDTGIWPGHRSFSDVGYGPVPTTWKGSCPVGDPDFPAGSCNKKLIGAYAFYAGYEANYGRLPRKERKSPKDYNGHGTHCASIAAGSKVVNAALFNYAKGTARGVATKARIAAYKACWGSECQDSDILAAMDKAIKDGVHIISASIGSFPAVQYDFSAIAIGSAHAAQSGVLVSSAAGNDGPGRGTVSNVAPWMLVVGASSIDRQFEADVTLADGRTFSGVTLYPGDPSADAQFLPIVTGENSGSKNCKRGQLQKTKVKGKIVVCEYGKIADTEMSYSVQEAGGAGMILINDANWGAELRSQAYFIPAVMVSYSAGDAIKKYASTPTIKTSAKIKFRGTVTGSATPSSPRVAAFSSRGPNIVNTEILKPDVIAPGVNILAAWSGAAGPTGLDFDTRRVEFNIISGTSMACPHVSGLAAMLKKAHPTWTPAAIMSAIMTTAYNIDSTGKEIIDVSTLLPSTPFVRGSGHIDPNKAVDPGLVYDLQVSDYIAFLCTAGYTKNMIRVIFKAPAVIDCASQKLSSPGNLNYPSFSVVFRGATNKVKYTRVVKNVGSSKNAVYKVNVKAPLNVQISVAPSTLTFTSTVQTLSYDITFTSTSRGASSFGSIEWSDGNHHVRSPIAIQWKSAEQEFLASI
ncbi:hypothetical protein BVRB_7g169840 [Beta vulgaris subsp. vulgaris]|uniref:subtilisin-like protease SBT1.4 n=1 Tax=Beta vulgaris subsp. vulgaris TaxID=3555 RepID=UPI00053F3010|nr:subtilisin-like protease SBT1.4 [Beta vulgaris subsp. vulgaris]KMT04813.1 hypothetical protein BVRB_7g169840 [Beta vulgaris subsp. vulgaris]